jgi:hypothetical protein
MLKSRGGLGCGSSGRMPAQQAQDPEFNTKYASSPKMDDFTFSF